MQQSRSWPAASPNRLTGYNAFTAAHAHVHLPACPLPACLPACLSEGSLGYGERLWIGDEPAEHPIDAPAGADATLLLASGSSAAAAAAAAVGASGTGGGRGRGKAPAVEGVHGGDKHMAEDEYARTVQVGGCACAVVGV